MTTTQSAPDWEMFTDEGNDAVEAMMHPVRAQVSIGRIDDAATALASGYREVAKVHAEIGDSAVREQIYDALGRALAAKWGGNADDYENLLDAFSAALF